MTKHTIVNQLKISPVFADFVEKALLDGLPVTAEDFWNFLQDLIEEFSPRTASLLNKREVLQCQIDEWSKTKRGTDFDFAEQENFLKEIGYLVPEGAPFNVGTTNVDTEISSIAGPQLVVPVLNARYSLNAANSRWRSLYDALYGTDVLGQPKEGGYDVEHGARVVEWASDFLDQALPLAKGSHKNVAEFCRQGNQLFARVDGELVAFRDPEAFAGFVELGEETSYFLVNNGLYIELVIDPSHPIGRSSASGLSDVIMESALTAIHDFEDSVAAVDATDKVAAYSNWLGLMRGDLTETFQKNGKKQVRALAGDRMITGPEGGRKLLRGRTLALARNVGHLMTTDTVLHNGAEIPEGILDALVSVTCALHDLAKVDGPRNSLTGSVYIVKPKMHGPEEVALANDIFTRVEECLGLAANTVKIGVMDEERRTSANLRECIRQVKDRIVFINTGFLDRTGDEIHTWMELGPVVPKEDMKNAAWLGAYEDGNVSAGLSTGMHGVGQIGKGMWAKPDDMAEMLNEKIAHPRSGANTAWVPSPTAATLHATHYHLVDVPARMKELRSEPRGSLRDLLTPPVLRGELPSQEDIQTQLDNNCQSILGYVVRWVDQGVGCSKVPDIHDVALMEDRATLRISSQLLANWLKHGLINVDQVNESLRKMAAIVDEQNALDAAYQPMTPACNGPAFNAARALVVEGALQPSGYTEPLLHTFRKKSKQLKGH